MRKKKGDMKLRRSAPRLKAKDRTYAHSCQLWIARGGAPSRHTVLSTLFSSKNSNKNKISYKGPTRHRDAEKDEGGSEEEEEEDEEEGVSHTAMFIDTRARFYFFPLKEANSFGVDAELEGIFLLTRTRNMETPVLGESIQMYRITGADIYQYAPYPTKQQIQEAQRFHRVRFEELRLKLADWFGLIDAKKESNDPGVIFTPESFTRKRVMTTGRIKGIAN